MKPKDNQPTRGIVHAEVARDKFTLNRFEPDPRLAIFVEHYWIVSYQLPPGERFTKKVLSFPNINLAFEQDAAGRRALVYGVPAKPFTRELQEAGRVLGVKFRAGGFYPFCLIPAANLTGATRDVRSLFGAAAAEWTDAVLDAGDAQAMAEQANALLLARIPQRDAQAELALQLVQMIMDQRELVKVEQLSGQVDIPVRQLQRLFRKYVGVSPKWVIKRFRLQEAAELLERNEPVLWAELAAQLGYYDQAHLIKDFQAVLGESPTSYRLRASPEGK